MSAEELQARLRKETGRQYIVKDANPFNEGTFFHLSEEGLRGLLLTQASVTEIEDFVVLRPLFEGKTP